MGPANAFVRRRAVAQQGRRAEGCGAAAAANLISKEAAQATPRRIFGVVSALSACTTGDFNPRSGLEPRAGVPIAKFGSF
ncbi:MAG: hypothetical protein C0511_16760 [Hyphomicrobium sp.]|nr:hypothetical protein [Hyphomicrobium sp.]